jgi:hypothetical protein
MADWDWAWQAGPFGVTLTELDDYCFDVRLLGEPSSGKRGDDIAVQYSHGLRAVVHKFANPRTLSLECVIRLTNSAGAITHSDGELGHFYENLAELKRLFMGQRGLATLQRTAPDWGAVAIDVELAEVVHDYDPNPYLVLFLLKVARPFWRSTSQSTDSSSPVAVGGDAPVDDATIVFSAGASSPVFTHTASGATITYTGTVPAGGVRVFTATGQASRVSGGADESANVSYNKTYILELDPGTDNAYTISSGTVTVEWYNKWN